MKRKAFTLIELLLAMTILITLISVIVINYDSLVGKSRYYEARENLKTYLINLKYQSYAFNIGSSKKQGDSSRRDRFCGGGE